MRYSIFCCSLTRICAVFIVFCTRSTCVQYIMLIDHCRYCSFVEVDNTNTISQEIPEEIYADYDSFDSDDSWDDCKNREKVNRVPYPCENRDLPAPPNQQNIYGLVPLVKKAGNRMKKRWSFGSLGLNRIRKLNVGNLTNDFGE